MGELQMAENAPRDDKGRFVSQGGVGRLQTVRIRQIAEWKAKREAEIAAGARTDDHELARLRDAARILKEAGVHVAEPVYATEPVQAREPVQFDTPAWEADLEREIDKILNPPKPVTKYDVQMEQLIQRGWSHEAAASSVDFDRQLDRSWAEHVASMGEGEALAREQSRHDRKQSRKVWTIVVLVGAFLAVLVHNFATTNAKQGSVAAKPAPAMSKDVAGMLVGAAMVQLEGDGFSVNSKETLTIEPYGPAEYCTGAPRPDQVQVVSATAQGDHVTMVIKDVRVCPAPAPVVVPPVNAGVPNPNLPNPPRVSSGGGSGGESRFCSKRWWC